MNYEFNEIDPKKYKGGIPAGFNLIIAEKENVEETALDLYHFDEIGLFDYGFKKPVYGFLKFLN